MNELKIGDKAPNFTLLSDKGTEVTLQDLQGKKVILYFYPKDNTPGCTIEAQNFNAAYGKLVKEGYEVFGVSRDTVKKHCNFRDKYELQFTLLADTEEVVCKAYDVLKEKKMYGRISIGIERSTFVIDEKGVLTHIYRGVKAKEHVGKLLEELAV